MAQAAIDGAKRKDAWTVDPSDLFIVGLDTKDGPEHPLWVADVNAPVDMGLVESIDDLSEVLEPVIVRKGRAKDGSLRWEVEVGRGRTKATRYVNELRASKNRDPNKPKDPVRLTVIVSSRPEADLGLVIAAENNARKVVGTAAKAMQALRLRAQGHTIKRVASAMVCSPEQVMRLCAIGQMAQPVLDAIDAGKLSLVGALALKDLDREAQIKAVEEVIAGESAEMVTSTSSTDAPSSVSTAAPALAAVSGGESAEQKAAETSSDAAPAKKISSTDRAKAAAAKAKGKELITAPSRGVIGQLIEASELGLIELDPKALTVLRWVHEGTSVDRIRGLTEALRVLSDPRVLQQARREASK